MTTDNGQLTALLPDRILPRQAVAQFLAPDLAERIPERVSVRLTAAVRHRLRRPERIAVADWAEKFRRVTAVDAHPGPWRHEFAPHCQRIMDVFGLPWVREVWFCGVEQSGKTNTMLNCLGWTIDRDPGNAYYLMPTEDATGKLVGRKLIPMLQASPALSKYISKRADDTTRGLIVLRHGVSLFPAHANSATSLATFSAKYGFGDEVDKYPSMVGKEADPITLIRKRARQHRGRHKFFFASTPAGQFIQKGLEACHQIWEFAMRCPDCGEHVRPGAEHLDLPEGATPESVEQDPASIGLACPDCGSIWTEADRESAIRGGRWQARKGAELTRPAKVGFHHRAWECLDVPLHEIAAAYLKSQSGDKAARTAWANGYEAIDYEPEKASSDHEEVLKLCDDRPRGLVPDAAATLVLNVDTQQDGFYYEVAAVGAWDGQTEPTTWLVEKGYLLDFASLISLAGRTWHSAGGKEYRIISALIDSGGTRKAGAPAKHSRTAEVYAFCKANPLFKPVKGTGRKKGAPVTYTKLDRYPGTSTPIPGGLQLVVMDVHYYKDELSRRLNLDPDAPGAFILYSGYTAAQLADPGAKPPENELIDYAKHLCAEYQDENWLWVHDKKAGRNDYHDCATYRMYHIDLLKQWGTLTPEQQSPSRRILSKGVIRD